MKQHFKRLTVLLSSLYLFALAGCSGSGSSSPTPPINPAAPPITATVDAAGKTTAATSNKSSDNAVTVTVPQSTVLYVNEARTELVPSGTLTVSVASLTSPLSLPPAAQSGLYGTGIPTFGLVADIAMTSGVTPVKAFGTPITVNLKLPQSYAAIGSSEPYYSIDSTGKWTQEGSATVKPDGSIDMSVTHLSLWGVANFNLVFTTAMLNGKIATIYSSCEAGSRTSTTTTIFNTDKTITASNIQSGTWSINTAGQLVMSLTTSPTYTETDTVTLTSATATKLTATSTWVNSSTGGSGSCTMTFTLYPDVSGNFTSAAGNYTVLSPNKGIITVDNSGILTITDSGKVIGSGKLTATSAGTLFDFAATFTDGDTIQGTLNTLTGEFSGTINNTGAWTVFAQKQ